jgi:cyclophilin family peptidyl-prolyl cis-trans isomerase
VPKATKRERQRQNRDARRQAVLEAEKRKRRNKAIRNGAIVLVVVVGLALLFSALNSDGGDSNSASATKNGCSTTVPPAPPTTTLPAAPAMTIDPAKQYTAVMKTSCGDITIALDAAQAPQTVNSFVTLARSGFYNGTLFHRIVTDFVDQGGDPTGNGSGGPGYELPDEPPANGYQAGSVAMANAGPGTTGSQFFLVVSDTGAKNLGTTPPYKYSTLGTMDSAGLKVAKKINSFGSSSSEGTPTQKVYVTSVEIEEGAGSTTTAPTTAAPTTTKAP